ncbi:helix-turn-helix domain-containing protein [Oceanirhabdus sp. W0125-5]|uniref:helix-turn-helix domain-containing protein n=1 Tax=Oceanirhabdus sp. W0125-5 TaxID=2999116 RepID=UPI0022F2F962|nr:helix-turn-helix transcriptional regulator [Oceanirhabdus sp. W0125-5]WBW97232.1 helix-turn-helix transcriptional regulator [Oceanirhabdus sp. W0125-5]
MHESNYYLKVGQTIKELREKQNMTKTELASGICSVSYITRIENGERCPTSVILRQLTTKLGISNEYLFRSIESDSAMHVHELLEELLLRIERHDFKSIYDLVTKEEKDLYIESIHDMQLFKLFKCMSNTILSEDYKSGLNELKTILDITYNKGNNTTGTEFSIMFMCGYFLLLDNQKEKAYTYLKSIRKYSDNIKFLSTRAIIPRYYVFLILACLDTSNIEECFEYVNYSIDYCKRYNKLTILRELYFLKGEIYYRLNNKDEFKNWYDKALIMHELIKLSDDDYFETLINIRLKQLKLI